MNGINACVVMARVTLASRAEGEVRGGARLLYVSKKKKTEKRNGTPGLLFGESRTTSMLRCMHAIGLLVFFFPFFSPMKYKAVVLVC